MTHHKHFSLFPGPRRGLDPEEFALALEDGGFTFRSRFPRGFQAMVAIESPLGAQGECTFDLMDDQPHIILSFPRRSFVDMLAEDRRLFEQTVLRAAERSCAAYVLVDYQGEWTEDFLDIDGIRVLDELDAYGLPKPPNLTEVWLSEAFGAEPPEGVKLDKGELQGHFYKRHMVLYA